MLQSLYESEFSDESWERILASQAARRASTEDTVEYARALLEKTLERTALLDDKIRAVLENWDFDRLSLIDRNILRFAIAEILFFPEVPHKVIINEAIEIAYKYSSQDAGKFINGILDRFAQEGTEDVV